MFSDSIIEHKTEEDLCTKLRTTKNSGGLYANVGNHMQPPGLQMSNYEEAYSAQPLQCWLIRHPSVHTESDKPGRQPFLDGVDYQSYQKRRWNNAMSRHCVAISMRALCVTLQRVISAVFVAFSNTSCGWTHSKNVFGDNIGDRVTEILSTAGDRLIIELDAASHSVDSGI